MNADKPTSEKEPSNRLALAVAAVAAVVAVILRIVPHPTSFSSVGAASLFGGARIRSWHAYLLPLGIMIVSDLALWAISGFNFNYSLGHPSRLYVYGSFMIYVAIGRWLSNSASVRSVALAAVLGGLQFFVLTNFCEWLFQPLVTLSEGSTRYSRDLSGLALCFVKALPFYPVESASGEYIFVFDKFNFIIIWTVLGDILFTTGYLLVHAKLVERAAQSEQAPVPVSNA